MIRNPTQLASIACIAALLAAGVPVVAALDDLPAAGMTSARAGALPADRFADPRRETTSSSVQPETFERSALIQALTAGSPEAAHRNPPASDPVTLGFARMLDHRPSGHSPRAPACSGTDPLVAAIVEPIRDGVWPPSAAARRVDAGGAEHC